MPDSRESQKHSVSDQYTTAVQTATVGRPYQLPQL